MALAKAIVKTRVANCQADYEFIASLAKEERLSFDNSGQPTYLESVEFLQNKQLVCILGTVSHELAGALILVSAPHPALPGKLDTLVLLCVVGKEWRGSKLFRRFNEIAIEFHKVAQNERLVCYALTTNPMIKAVERLGWRAERVELVYEGHGVVVARPETSLEGGVRIPNLRPEPESIPINGKVEEEFIGL